MFNSLKFRTSGNQCLTSLVALVLLEVLDEAGSQILGLLLPLIAVLIGVTRIENAPSHAVELCGNLEVEVWDLLGRSVQDVTTQDSVDDAAGLTDGGLCS